VAAVIQAPAPSRFELVPRHRRALLEHCRREVRQIERFLTIEAAVAGGRGQGEASDEAAKLLRLATGLRRGLDKWR
jgi:hypothetical protein